MSELSPSGGSEREGELAQRAKRDRPGAYGACDDEGAASWTRRKPSPHRGEGGPKGRMRGQIERGVTPVGTLISLASLDSFP